MEYSSVVIQPWSDRHLYKIGNCQIKSELIQLIVVAHK